MVVKEELILVVEVTDLEVDTEELVVVLEADAVIDEVTKYVELVDSVVDGVAVELDDAVTLLVVKCPEVELK